MNQKESKLLILQLFADGGDGGSTGAETGDTGADAALQTGENALPIRYLDEEQTAQQDPDAGDQTEEAAETEDLDAEFDALIKKGGKFADVYRKKFQEALHNRMHTNKEQEEYNTKSRSVIQKLAQVYKVSPDDLDAITKALDSDDKLYADAAMEAGMSVETFREVNRVKAENEVYKMAEAERIQREEADRTFRQWLNEADSLRETYPNFDLESEIQNPVFAGLLRNGFTVKNAYESAHHEELMSQAIQTAAQQAQSKLSKSIAANRSRPEENAGSRNSAATIKRDVESLTDEELDEIDRLSRKRRISLA